MLATDSLRPVASWALVLLFIATSLAACGAPRVGEGDGGAGSSAGTAVAEDGAALYAANCAACHGPDGEGTTVGPPLAHIIYEPGHHSDDSFRRAMSDGVVPHHWDFGPMPPQPQVDDEEADAIIGHVRDLQREAGIIE